MSGDREGAWSSRRALTKAPAGDPEVEEAGSSPSGISVAREKKKNGKPGEQSREVGGQRPT